MLSRSVLSKLISTASTAVCRLSKPSNRLSLTSLLGLNGWQMREAGRPGRLSWRRFRNECLPERHAGGCAAGLDGAVAGLPGLLPGLLRQGGTRRREEVCRVNFIRLRHPAATSPPSCLLEHLAKLDTTQGKPEDELIIFTTIFRTKGLEYDYVVLPQCDDNLLPYLKGERTDIFDTQGLVREWEMSSKLESERRLFYVALTRARKGVLIGVIRESFPLPGRRLAHRDRCGDERRHPSGRRRSKALQAAASKL